jgi:hypothetical protein
VPDPVATGQSDLDRLVRRLRHLSPREWERRRDAVRATLEALAAMTAPGHELPVLPDHALADAVAVLGADALDEPAHAEGAARLLRDALAQTR